MNKKHNYTDKKNYIEVTLFKAFEPMTDFDGIAYTVEPTTDSEYMRLTSLIGRVAYFNISGFSKGEILKDIYTLIFGDGTPNSLIDDENQIRQVAPLFRRKG